MFHAVYGSSGRDLSSLQGFSLAGAFALGSLFVVGAAFWMDHRLPHGLMAVGALSLALGRVLLNASDSFGMAFAGMFFAGLGGAFAGSLIFYAVIAKGYIRWRGTLIGVLAPVFAVRWGDLAIALGRGDWASSNEGGGVAALSLALCLGPCSRSIGVPAPPALFLGPVWARAVYPGDCVRPRYPNPYPLGCGGLFGWGDFTRRRHDPPPVGHPGNQLGFRGEMLRISGLGHSQRGGRPSLGSSGRFLSRAPPAYHPGGPIPAGSRLDLAVPGSGERGAPAVIRPRRVDQPAVDIDGRPPARSSLREAGLGSHLGRVYGQCVGTALLGLGPGRVERGCLFLDHSCRGRCAGGSDSLPAKVVCDRKLPLLRG